MRRRARTSVAIAFTVAVVMAIVTIAVVRWDVLTTRSSRLAARSLRAAVGAPVRATKALITELPVVERRALATHPKKPSRPRGLDDTSFVLLLGVDKTHRKITGRTDSIIVAAFRHRDGKVGAFSIPRDLWVDIPDKGPGRINAVVRIGNLRGPGQGIPLLERVIEQELGIEIDRHAAVDVDGFVELVDQRGGIDVDVQCPIRDCFWTTPQATTCEPLDLEAGTHHLDGRTALLYARSRHGRGDRDRQRRQQVVLMAFARDLRKVGLRGLPELWRQAESHIDTNIDVRAAAYYGSFALETDPHDIHGFSIKHPLTRKFVTEDNKHVLLLDRELFQERLADLFKSPLPAVKGRKHCPDVDAALVGR